MKYGDIVIQKRYWKIGGRRMKKKEIEIENKKREECLVIKRKSVRVPVFKEGSIWREEVVEVAN